MNDILQADFEQLEEIGNLFGVQADIAYEIISRIRQPYHELVNGGWEGEGADAFFQEMEGEIFPVLDRLAKALEDGQTLMGQIEDVFKTHEEEAAAPFQPGGNGFDPDGGGSGAGASGGVGAGSGSGAGGGVGAGSG